MKFKKYLNEQHPLLQDTKNKKYKVKGVNQDMDVCDLCGKCNLKKVVWLAEINSQGEEVGDPFAVGTDCASKLLTGRKNTKVAKHIWELAKGLDKAKEFVQKYKTEKELNKVIDFLRVRYPLNGEVVMDNKGEKPKGIILIELGEKPILWSMTTTGKFKRWPESFKSMVGAANWVRMKG